MRILLAGGGSAGHTSPLLATAAALSRLGDERGGSIEISCLGTREGLEARLIPEAGYPLDFVPKVPLPRTLGADVLRVPQRLLAARRAALAALDKRQPDVVVGFGGYVSVPAYLAARARKVPIVVHEGNALPGVANRLGARMTDRVATSFPGTDLPHAVFTGLPIRRMIANLQRGELRAQARAEFGLSTEAPVLLVFGGSQGAASLNAAVSGAAGALAESGIEVVHIVGGKQHVDVPEIGTTYRVLPYVDRMDLAYAAADLALCRCGSNTVTEVSGVGLPAVYVPLPHGNGEQELNARPVIEAGGGVLVPDGTLTSAWVSSEVPRLLAERDALDAMGQAARGALARDADEALARMILESVSGGRR